MQIPSGIKKIFIPLGLIFLFAAAWYGLYEPEFRKIAKYKTQPAAARAQIEKMIQQLGAYNPPADTELAEWKILEEKINRKIPTGKQITELYSLISALAEKDQLADLQRQEVDASDKEYTDNGITRNGYDVNLKFQGTYSSLAKFIGDLQNSERLIEIVTFNVNRHLPMLQVEMVLRTYYLPVK